MLIRSCSYRYLKSFCVPVETKSVVCKICIKVFTLEYREDHCAFLERCIGSSSCNDIDRYFAGVTGHACLDLAGLLFKEFKRLRAVCLDRVCNYRFCDTVDVAEYQIICGELDCLIFRKLNVADLYIGCCCAYRCYKSEVTTVDRKRAVLCAGDRVLCCCSLLPLVKEILIRL